MLWLLPGSLHKVDKRHNFVAILFDLLLHLLICRLVLTADSFGKNAKVLLHGAQMFPSPEFLQDGNIHSAVEEA